MDKKNLIYFSLGFMLILPSCSQETPINGEFTGADRRIYFRSYLPAVDLTRAGVISDEKFTNCQVTCFNLDDDEYYVSDKDSIKPYFSDVRFEKASDGRFLSSGKDDCRWPDTEHTLHFLSYYPSVDSLKSVLGNGYFKLINESNRTDGSSQIKYRLENFQVPEDIADQVDFITAYSNGTLTKEAEQGIKLDFKHHLARIELSAWSGSEKYDFEIAGVRIGNALVDADFDFTAIMQQEFPWVNIGQTAPVEHIFSEGESIVVLSKNNNRHSDEDHASSIMGAAGAAMVIPMSERIDPWEGKADPNINADDYSTGKMYFSVLLRVKNNAGEVAYPYPNDRDNMTVIYLVVDNEGVVSDRVYLHDGEFYTSTEKNEDFIFTPSEDQEVCGFGWATLPVPAKWEAGKIYTYKLNYSTGIGWHDPSDPNPGEPIIERAQIPFAVNVEDWAEANDYDPNLNVPKR